jgi:hypothetical protein
MERGKELEKQVYEPEHIQRVLDEITISFPGYFEKFFVQNPGLLFIKSIREHESEQESYRNYLDLLALEELEDNPNAFKHVTKTSCPIIRRCLMSQDEVMKQYKIAFHDISGRQLLDGVKNIAQFGIDYAASFNDARHEAIRSYPELGLEKLNEAEYGAPGVVGYGIQSSLLYGKFPHAFAHRSQNAVWALHFITNRKSFGLEDGSEFLMVQPRLGTCEQNFFYPAELFGFYALKLYLMLKKACAERKLTFHDRPRYLYLNAFTDFVADLHRDDINVYKWTSENVENHWH